MSMRIIIAAGGTGGHVIPGIAIAEQLRERHEVMFVGTGRALEQRLVSGAGFALHEVPAVPLLGKGMRGLSSFALTLPRALLLMIRLLRQLRPSVVVGFGGYPSFVPVLAARLCGIPAVLHESNVRVGLANKALSVLAHRVFAVRGASGFWSSKITLLPNPVRPQFYGVSTYEAPARDGALRLLVTGGSQGAVALNSALVELAPWLASRGVEVWHQTGANDAERVRRAYAEAGVSARVAEFIDDVAAAYSWSQLVICRAGAMTVAEICAAGRPAIFVPLAIAGGHQIENCRELVARRGGLVIEQTPALAQELRTKFEGLLAAPETLASMAATAREASAYGETTPAAFIAQEIERIGTQVRADV